MQSPVQTQPVASFVHGPGQQVQLAPLMGPGSNSHSGLIDPCNLFCKVSFDPSILLFQFDRFPSLQNLDPDIDSNGLFTHFRQVNQIVVPFLFEGLTDASFRAVWSDRKASKLRIYLIDPRRLPLLQCSRDAQRERR